MRARAADARRGSAAEFDTSARVRIRDPSRMIGASGARRAAGDFEIVGVNVQELVRVHGV